MCATFTSSQAAPSARTSRIEPSTSVRRNVTVPIGSTDRRHAALRGSLPAHPLGKGRSMAIAASGRSLRIAVRPSPPITSYAHHPPPRGPRPPSVVRGAPRAPRSARPARRSGSAGSNRPASCLSTRTRPSRITNSSSPTSPSVMIASCRTRSPALGDRGDTLQVLRVEPLEQRDTPKLEHPLDLAEARVRAGHGPSVARAPRRQGPDPRVVIMPQGVEHVAVGTADGRDRIQLDEPRDGPPEPPITHQIDVLDRLRTHVPSFDRRQRRMTPLASGTSRTASASSARS